MAGDWCQYCGATIDADEPVAVMAGLRYHPECAEADKDFMDRAASHYDADCERCGAMWSEADGCLLREGCPLKADPATVHSESGNDQLTPR